MKHVFWVYPGEVAGRPGPSVAPWRLSELKAGGFDVVLSVASDLFAHSDPTAVGITRSCIPLPDVVPPDDQTIRVCTAALPLTFEFIQSQVREGAQVLVHCAGGCDRTGLVLSHYIARREGLDASAAIQKVRAVRPEALSAPGWEEMALEVIPKLIR